MQQPRHRLSEIKQIRNGHERGDITDDCILPAVISVGGKPRVVLPDDQLYPHYPDELNPVEVDDADR